VRIDGWEIAGFGCLQGWHSDGLAEHDVVVVLGPNESGKSTLRAFLETALYGFAPATREQNPYTPEDDGPFGGTLRLAGPDGTRIAITRQLKATPRGRIERGTGHEDIANRPAPETGSVGRAMYGDLHSITIDGLLAVGDPTWRTVEERLLTGSGLAFLRSAIEARAQLDARANAIWRPDRRGTTAIRVLDERIRDLQEAERAALASVRRLTEVQAELESLTIAEAEIRASRARAGARRELHDRLGPASAAIADITRARARAAELLPHDGLPVDPDGALQRAREATARAERLVVAAGAEHDRLCAAAREPLDTAVLDQAAAIDGLAATSGIEDELARRQLVAADAVAARSAERARIARIVLDRDVTDDDLAALSRISPAGVRAAIARRDLADRPATGRRLALAVGGLAAAFLALAAGGSAGRAGPIAAAAVLAAVALALAAPRGARDRAAAAAELERALAGLQIAPQRRAIPDAGLVAEVDALVSAHALLCNAVELLAAEQETARARAARRAEVLASVGAADVASATRRLAEARTRTIAVQGARDAVAGARLRHDDATAELDDARLAEQAISERLLAVDPDPDRALERVREARRLRGGADERERSARATYGDLERTAAAIASGELAVLSPQELEALAVEEQEQAHALEEVRHRRGALEAERDVLSAAGSLDPGGAVAACREQREQLARERDRIAFVASTIAAAERRFRERHGPAFLAAAGRHLAHITGGRYHGVHLAADSPEAGAPRLELVREDGERRPVAPPLSRGTLEQVYLALRLALLDELDPTSLLPLYLDEALVNWDDRRSDGLIALLGSLGGRQAIVGTCHPELAERLAASGAVVVATPTSPTALLL
jgi:uncharacterized protein YhaN